MSTKNTELKDVTKIGNVVATGHVNNAIIQLTLRVCQNLWIKNRNTSVFEVYGKRKKAQNLKKTKVEFKNVTEINEGY